MLGESGHIFSLPCPFVIDAGDAEYSNWTRYINHSLSSCNVVARIKRVDRRELENGVWEEEDAVVTTGLFHNIPKHEAMFWGDKGWVNIPDTTTSIRVEFYTSIDVEKGEELKFDYGEEFRGEFE